MQKDLVLILQLLLVNVLLLDMDQCFFRKLNFFYFILNYLLFIIRSFPIMKKLIYDQVTVSETTKKAVIESKDHKELFDAMKKDFWVVTPCYSTANPGKVMEGTRLTLQATLPEGYEYSIRTPGTPPRWVDYDIELTHCFTQFCIEARKPENERNLDK